MNLEDLHYYEPSQGHGLRHDPFNAIIAPRPIGWISSLSKSGQLNLAPYSFFNAFNYDPPILGFASIAWKDSGSRDRQQSGTQASGRMTTCKTKVMVYAPVRCSFGLGGGP
jgi:hypothetical protein